MNLLKKLKGFLLKNKAVLLSVATVGLVALVAPSFGFAGVKEGVSMASINGNVTGAMKNMTQIIHAVSIIGGVAFFAAFAFKAKQHRDNPTQVTIGQPLMYLFLAIILSMLPYFISSSKQIVYGKEATISQWNHAGLDTLLGPTGTPTE